MSDRTHVVILGAGFGGLELSSRLSEQLADAARVTLIDKSDAFIFGFAKLDVMFGRTDLKSVRLPYRDIAKPAVDFRQEEVVSIDPDRRRVVTDKGTYDADILVVALGADYDTDATPGLLEGGYEFYSPEGAASMRATLESFDRGIAVIAVLGPFFKCPPAPSETALLLHDFLTARGVRDAVTIRVLSPLPTPVPVSVETSDAILAEFAKRDIEYRGATRVVRLDPARRIAVTDDGTEVPFDLFLGVPVHKAPDVVVKSGLTEDDGWIAVDPWLATKFDGVYAVGDVASAPVPRAGVFAEGEAGTVADVIVHKLRGGAAPPRYGGIAGCYIEFGDDRVAMVNVDFLTGPEMSGTFSPPSHEIAREKEQFGATRRGKVVRHTMSMWQGQRIQEVEVSDADAGRDHHVLLDVRNADEWDAGHAPGAVWVPLGELEGARFSLPINRRIVCICRVGQRSARATAELVQMGFDAVNMTGGMKEWAARGLPVVRDDGTPGTVV